MNNLFSRISKRLRYTLNSFHSDCHFSLYYALLRIMDEIGGRLGAKSLSRRAHNKKNQWILHYLIKLLQPILKNMQNADYPGEYVNNAPIWICWWDGEDTAPPLVKKCISSIRQNAGEHPVHLITEKNYNEYLEIPEYMLKKVQMNTMGLAHLSDYIRVSLLEKFGGLWLDATIYCSRQIPDEYFKYPVFTCKSPLQSCSYISQMQWTTFVLGGWRKNDFYRFLKASFEQYWSINDYAIDYLFFDYLILIAKNEIPFVSDSLEEIPINNLHRDDLQAAMNATLPAEDFSRILQPDTGLYKLSWREQYAENTPNAQESIYSYFISQ